MLGVDGCLVMVTFWSTAAPIVIMKTNVHADQEDISSLINWKLIVCTDHPGSTDLYGPTVRARARELEARARIRARVIGLGIRDRAMG